MARKKSWEEIEREYFISPGKEEFHGYVVAGVVEHWDHCLVKVDYSFNTEKEAQDCLDKLQARIDEKAAWWPNFWWRQFTMKAYLKVYKFDRVTDVKEISKQAIGRTEEECKNARRTARYLLVLCFAILAYCIYRIITGLGFIVGG